MKPLRPRGLHLPTPYASTPYKVVVLLEFVTLDSGILSLFDTELILHLGTSEFQIFSHFYYFPFCPLSTYLNVKGGTKEGSLANS